MTSAYTDWPLLLKRPKALKNTLLLSPRPTSFHIRWEKKAYTTCCVIYNAVVIHSQLTFRGHCKSCVFGVNAFLSSGRSATFWRPSWTCSKGSDPGYRFPAWPLQARGVGSSAIKQQENSQIYIRSGIVQKCSNYWCLYERGICNFKVVFCFLKIWNLAAYNWCLAK